MDKKLFRKIVLLMGIAAVLALTVIKFDTIWAAAKTVVSVATPITVGLLIAIFLDRPFSMFRKLFLKIFHWSKHKYTVSNALAVVVTFLLLISFVTVFAIAVIPEITSSIAMLLENLSSYIENVQNSLNAVIESNELLKQNVEPFDFTGWDQWIKTLITKVIETITTRLPEIFNITKSIAGCVTNAVLSVIISIYLLLGRSHLKWQTKKLIYAFFPENVADKIRETVKLTTHTISGYISGRVIDSIIVGILCFIFMKIFGFEYAALISFIIGATNIIPMLGPFIGAIPSALLLFLISPAQCFWFIIFVIILQQVDSNIIDPRISGEATGLPALWVLISITLGGGLFGIPGLILSVPICAVLYILTRKAVATASEKKGIPLNDETDRDPGMKKWTIGEIKEALRGKSQKKDPAKEKK